MKFISRDVMRLMPWKNGGGETLEIAIEPKTSDASTDEFHWRLSSATVVSTGPFSTFENYDRILMVLDGTGLELNGRVLTPFVPFRFRGEEHIICRPLDTPLHDLGVIFRRGFFEVDMEVLDRTALSQLAENLDAEATSFVFDLETGDVWRFDPGVSFGLEAKIEFNKSILIQIRAVNP